MRTKEKTSEEILIDNLESLFKSLKSIDNKLSRMQEYLQDKESKMAICAICLEKYNERLRTTTFLPCCHHFHSFCIFKWFSSKTVCPLCREKTLT